MPEDLIPRRRSFRHGGRHEIGDVHPRGEEAVGSTRGGMPSPSKDLYDAPGAPQGMAPQSGDIIQHPVPIKTDPVVAWLKTLGIPEDLEQWLQAKLIESLQLAFDRFSIYAQVKPYDDYDVYSMPLLAGVPARLDPLGDSQKSRRALLIVNPDAANAIWVGKNNLIAAGIAGSAIPVAPNFGSYLVAIHERAPHYGVCVGGNSAIVAWYR